MERSWHGAALETVTAVAEALGVNDQGDDGPRIYAGKITLARQTDSHSSSREMIEDSVVKAIMDQGTMPQDKLAWRSFRTASVTQL